MPKENPLLGTGWGFPPTFQRGTGSVDMSTDVEDIRSSLEILLSTNLGERIMQPTYGANLRRLLFEPLDTSLKAYVKDLIKTAILYHEPRIRLDVVELEANSQEGIIAISLEYNIRTTNTRYNYVYPFYLNEGTNINP